MQMHMLVKYLLAGNSVGRALGRCFRRIQKIDAFPGVTSSSFFYYLVDASIGAKRERVIVSGERKFVPGALVIGEGQVTPSQAELQICELRIDRGGFPVSLQRLPECLGCLQRHALPVTRFPV